MKADNAHTKSTPETPQEGSQNHGFQLTGFLRLPQVLALIPISKSAWWAGCKSGRYPKPIKLGLRTTVWRASDIAALLERLSKNEGGQAKP